VTERYTLRGARPHAVLDEVPAPLQWLVVNLARDRCFSALEPIPPACLVLHRPFGQPDFYDVLAQLNAARAADWSEMARVQRTFHEAEPSFDRATRAYSESMRLTLHVATLLHVRDIADIANDRHFFERFLELHVTAFFENGAWLGNMHIAWCGALDVVGATRLTMIAHAPELIDGAFTRDAHAVTAAQWVREARRGALAGQSSAG
jgi:hypothetical protein